MQELEKPFVSIWGVLLEGNMRHHVCSRSIDAEEVRSIALKIVAYSKSVQLQQEFNLAELRNVEVRTIQSVAYEAPG